VKIPVALDTVSYFQSIIFSHCVILVSSDCQQGKVLVGSGGDRCALLLG
jgi:hypothetical protein